MTIKELFEYACNGDYTDLQALIMFLVFEKKVLSMDDHIKELDLYFLPKHRKRMNYEISKYRKKMNITYGLQVFEIKSDNRTAYIAAYTEKQAKYIARQHLVKVDAIKICDLKELMTYNNKHITLETLIRDKKPCVLGGF